MPTKLGQNFLKDEAVVSKIIEAADLSPEDVVLEVGPGKGVLTKKLMEACKKVAAIEIDQQLVKLLENTVKQHGNNIEIIEGDVLKINLPELVTNFNFPDQKYKVIANIPYYITAPIIRLFLETKYPPGEMILMVQKEVAERICASPREIPTESRDAKRISRGKPGNMSILSVAVQYYADPEILFTVSKNSFDPVPEVDSAVLRIKYKVLGIRHPEETKKFFRIVRAGFSAKRKTLANNLANSLHMERKIIEEKLGTLGFDKKIRAQELGLEDWKKLADLF